MKNDENKKRVLLHIPDGSVRSTISRILRSRGFLVTEVSNLNEAKSSFKSVGFALVITSDKIWKWELSGRRMQKVIFFKPKRRDYVDSFWRKTLRLLWKVKIPKSVRHTKGRKRGINSLNKKIDALGL